WGDILGADFRGRARYSRHFNRPTGLDPHEHVWCVIDGVDPTGSATLNGQPLGEVPGYALPAEFEITSLLQERNELTLDIETPAANSPQTPRPGRDALPGGPIGEVRLEVRTGHFLHALSVWVSAEQRVPKLRVTGQIAGEAKSTPLAVVVQA